MKKKKRRIIITISVLITIFLLIFTAIQLGISMEISALCEDIKDGKEITTTIKNTTTYPKMFRGIATFFGKENPKIPLVEACYYGNIQAVKVLVENGADPNFYFKGDKGTLDGTINGNGVNETSFEIIKLLIEHGADVDGCGSGKPITFQLAALLNNSSAQPIHENIILYLLDNGAAKEESGNNSSLLHYSVSADKAEFSINLIVEYDFDINARNNNGMTPLMMAAENNSINIIPLLMNFGANKNLKSNDGKTAYDYAVEKGYTDITEILK